MHTIGINRLSQQDIIVNDERHPVDAADITNAAQFLVGRQLESFVAVLHEAGAALKGRTNLVQCGQSRCLVVGNEVKTKGSGQP